MNTLKSRATFRAEMNLRDGITMAHANSSARDMETRTCSRLPAGLVPASRGPHVAHGPGVGDPYVRVNKGVSIRLENLKPSSPNGLDQARFDALG